MENGNEPQITQVQVPVIPLNQASVQIVKDAQGEPLLFIGPVILALPIGGEDAKKAIIDALTGIKVARPGEM